VAGLVVRPMGELEQVVAEQQVCIGVIAVPAAAAQPVCDRLVACGVTSILNFAPSVLTVPAGVDVRKVDLSLELAILSFHETHKAGQLTAASTASSTATSRAAGARAVRV